MASRTKKPSSRKYSKLLLKEIIKCLMAGDGAPIPWREKCLWHTRWCPWHFTHPKCTTHGWGGLFSGISVLKLVPKECWEWPVSESGLPFCQASQRGIYSR